MKAHIYVFCLILLSLSAFGMGLAAPPQKSYDAYIGQNLTYTIQVINEEGKEGTYYVYLDGALKDRATANPSVFNIPAKSSFDSGMRTSKITVTSQGILPGKYDLTIVIELRNSDHTDLSIIQQVTRTITVNFAYPPSFLARVMNFIVLSIKKSFSYIIDAAKNIYRNNPWINYMILFICLVVFFYAGTRADKIAKWVKKKILRIVIDIEKMTEIGFFRWIWIKLTNLFKKRKKEAKEYEAEFKRGP